MKGSVYKDIVHKNEIYENAKILCGYYVTKVVYLNCKFINCSFESAITPLRWNRRIEKTAFEECSFVNCTNFPNEHAEITIGGFAI